MNILKKLFFAQKASADGGGSTGGTVKLPNPLGTTNIIDIVNSIADWLIKIAAPIVTIMVLIGAFQMLFAGGNPETFKKGQKTILFSVIGFVIVLLAKGIAAIVKAVATNTAP